MDFFEKIDLKKREWPFLTMSAEDQAAWVRKEIVSRITSNLLKNDPIVEITLLEEAHDIIKNTIMTTGPDEEVIAQAIEQAKGHSNLDENQIRFVYQQTLQNVVFNSETGYNIIPGSVEIDNIPPELIFVQLKTQSALEMQELTEWASAVGLTPLIEASHVNFSIDHIRSLYGWHLLMSLGRKGIGS